MCLLAGMPVCIFVLSFSIGKYAVSPAQLIAVLYGKLTNGPVTWTPMVETILFDVRLPRIIIAMLAGASLSVAGATYQGFFRNPMVSPDILGATNGAGFGAVLAILFSLNQAGVQMLSFSMGVAAVLLTYFVSKIVERGNGAELALVLTGLVVSALFSAFISMTKYVADPENKLPAITFWLLGGLSDVTKEDIPIVAIPFVAGVVPILLLRWQLNALSFGEEEAKAMGVDAGKVRLLFIVCSTILTASSVSVAGVIGWVGLIIPHISRLLVGPSHNYLIPVSLLIGSSFMLVVDDVARTAFSTEIPLGILTSIIGAPFFLYLLTKRRHSWS